tara:strand:+ start:12247 stop:12969 length:723 start_codon:yes stop_codon:yes gene_type:complete
LELLQKKDNQLGIIISITIHLFLLIAIFFSKGCMELQNPPQFTLEEVITLDFSDAGGGSPGSSSPIPPTIEEESPAEKVITQEESPVVVKSSNSNVKNENESKKAETKEVPKPKNDFSSLFGKGNGDSEAGNGEGDGTGIGTGKGPNTGGGFGTGKGRQVIGNPELDNFKNWVGFVMVQFTINAQGNVLETKVLYPHSKTTITLSSNDQKFIANDCKIKFKFNAGISKDRLVKRIQYIEK